MKNISVCVYVPARISSTRLRQKALLDFNGDPLITRVIKELSQAATVTSFCVNTESLEIADVARGANCNVYIRNPELALDSTTTEEILADFLGSVDTDYVAAVNPTSPLLRACTIDYFFDSVAQKSYDTAFSVTELKKHVVSDDTPVNYSPFGPHPRTQDVKPLHVINWAISTWRTDVAKEKIKKRGDSLYPGHVGFIPIPDRDSIDIDNQFDFDLDRSVDKLKE